MTILSTGSVINPLFGYASEQVQIRKGLRSFNTVGLAIVDPNSTSTDIPFISPSKQKGRVSNAFSIPAGAFITHVGFRIPANVVLENNEEYEIGPALAAARNTAFTCPAPADISLDYVKGWSVADFAPWGVEYTAAQSLTAGMQTITEVADALADLRTAGAATLADQADAEGDALAAAWLPRFLSVAGSNPPTTRNGKKDFIILEVGGYYLDGSVADYESATSGALYLLD